MLMINGKWQRESPVTISSVETAALDMKPEKNRPKKRIVHGVETRHCTRD